MRDIRQAARMALEALTSPEAATQPHLMSAVAQTLLRAAIEAPEAEPVAVFHAHPADWQYSITLLPGVPMLPDGTQLYAAPQPAREPVRLSEAEFAKAAGLIGLSDDEYHICRAVERAVLAANGMGERSA